MSDDYQLRMDGPMEGLAHLFPGRDPINDDELVNLAADALSRYRELLREAAAKFTEIAWLVNSCNGLDASRDCANLAARIRKEIGE